MLFSKEIKLRPLKTDDIEKTLQWRNDVSLTKLTMGIRFPKTLEMEKEWYSNVLTNMSNRNIYWGIDEVENNELIGIIQLMNIDWISRTSDFGINIGNSNNRGRGFGKQAMELVLDYAFCALDLRKISLHVIEINKKAIKLYQDFGFTLEGKLIKQVYFDNTYYNVLIMSLFKDVYLSKLPK